MEVTLNIIKGFDEGKTFVFNNPEIFIAGRSSDSKIRFSKMDTHISRNHFLLEIAPPSCLLRNLSKTNHTFVNNKPIEEELLKNNDIIQAGYTFIRVNIFDEVSTINKKCIKCNNLFIVEDKYTADLLCESCIRNNDQMMLQQKKEKDRISCFICNKDLTRIGNSDGRHNELSGKVKYYCSGCINTVDFLPGEKIGKYEKIRFLAHGGMGEVYLVYDRSTARLLVLKRILGLADNEIIRKHFEREIIVHQKLNNPNIIHYIDTGVVEGDPFIVMEYAEGDNLDSFIESHNGKVPVKQGLQIMIQAVKGIQYLHQLEPPVIHRDIKPANIMLQNAGDEYLVKIADFGLSKPYNEAGGLSFTRIGEMKGSKMFISPQQIKDTKNVNLSSDIYSLGVTAYYLFTGKLPYNYPSILERNQLKEKFAGNRARVQKELEELGCNNNLLSLILSNSIVPIEQKVNSIPKQVGSIINKMLRTMYVEYTSSSVLSDLVSAYSAK
jgi:eukaryotic-like serine/threonine-protein kinase